jgi:hypothetical protein
VLVVPHDDIEEDRGLERPSLEEKRPRNGRVGVNSGLARQPDRAAPSTVKSTPILPGASMTSAEGITVGTGVGAGIGSGAAGGSGRPSGGVHGA